MKRSDLTKVIGVGVLSASLAVLPLVVPANAQTSPGSGGTTSGSTVDNTSRTGSYGTTDRNDFDWGWIGLLGLAGLIGLIPRKREESVRYRDPDETTRPGSRL